MKKRTILVIGGARSGKSSFAQQLAADSGGRVCFLATAEAGDEEMRKRIQCHRISRPRDWATRELERGTTSVTIPEDVDVLLMDCFTIYLANLMAEVGLAWAEHDEDLMPEEEVTRLMDFVEKRALETVEGLVKTGRTLIIVSNEVGMGLVPPFRLGRIFRDLAGRLNQRLAEIADEVHVVFAGLPLCLKDDEEWEE